MRDAICSYGHIQSAAVFYDSCPSERFVLVPRRKCPMSSSRKECDRLVFPPNKTVSALRTSKVVSWGFAGRLLCPVVESYSFTTEENTVITYHLILSVGAIFASDTAIEHKDLF